MSQPLQAQDAAGRVGQIVEGRWRLERLIGTGAMAAVYAARDSSGNEAAVKILHPELVGLEDSQRRFAREAELACRIDHPGVVRVIDAHGAAGSPPFIAMELLQGEPLSERLRREPTLPQRELLELLDQLLDALAAAHAQGVVHRDLKPANLFLTQSGMLKVLDFGVARPSDAGDAHTRLGLAVGTIAYMAPEQALGRHQEVDGKSDLFAVGAIAFFMLAGRHVHEAKDDSELLSLMATQPAPPLASVAPGVAADVCAVIDLALAFSREARYPDARTMQSDVRALLSSEPPPYASLRHAARDQATVMSAAAPAPSSQAQADPLVGQLLADRYRVEALLGSGGMGSVYRAQHVLMRKAVAIKVLHREMTTLPEIVARFEREAVAAGRIDHPNVASARDFGRLNDGSFYLVLEYVEGRSLRALLDQQGKLPPVRAVGIARQVADALGAAHEAGIVHRDLKPDNVMLVHADSGDDNVKVLDFGIAKVLADENRDKPALTRVGAIFGTPEYMSPEQALGQSVDARSDLYSLGIIFYEMLAGKKPFDGNDMVSVLSRQMTEEPPPLPEEVDPRLCGLVAKLLAKSADQRVQDARELAQELAIWCGEFGDAALGTLSSARRANLELGDTVLNLTAQPGVTARTGRTLSRAALGLLMRRVRIREWRVPIWGLVGALALSIAAVLAVMSTAASADHGGTPVVSIMAPLGIGIDAQLKTRLERAERGDRPALAELETRPLEQRRAYEWRALARGYAHIGDYNASLGAYQRVLQLEPKLRDDPQTLADLASAAEQPAYSERALRMIAALGESGADLLYELWRGLAQRSPKLSQNAKQMLDSEAVVAEMTPALRVAIDLRDAKGCSAYKEVLPRAAEHGDQRAAAVLERLTRRRGCGFFRRHDCYPCLRKEEASDMLKNALEATKARPGPKLSGRVEADDEG